MSLEDTLDKLASAVRENTEALKAVKAVNAIMINGSGMAPAANIAAATAATEPAKAKKDTKKKDAVPQTATTPAASTITMKEVADVIIDLADKVSRDAAVAVLSKLGVARVGELKPAQFDEAVRLAREAMKVAPTVAVDEDSLV